VVDTYNVGDELEGTVTKVVAFGAFVEILEGVEGLVHISELAQQHVENPREIVQPGDDVKVKILEIDSERRRLSLSIKRVEGQVLPRRDAGDTPVGDAGDMDDMPELGLSEDVFAESPEAAAPDEALAEEPLAEAALADEPLAEAALADEPLIEDSVAEEPVAEEPVAEEPVAAEEPEEPAEEPVAADEPEPAEEEQT
jgi:small subunit ribosomal protein S1